MRILFGLGEILVALMLIWVVANLIRYFMRSMNPGGGFFGLSENWLNKKKEAPSAVKSDDKSEAKQGK